MRYLLTLLIASIPLLSRADEQCVGWHEEPWSSERIEVITQELRDGKWVEIGRYVYYEDFAPTYYRVMEVTMLDGTSYRYYQQVSYDEYVARYEDYEWAH